MLRLLALFCVSIVLFSAKVSDAAQSTADVPVTEAMKESLLVEILGPRAEQIRREEAYVIGHGDILSVSIFEEGDMSAIPLPGITRQDATGDSPRSAASGVQVMLDGRISLRNIGDVEVVGLTLTQLADYLKKLYSSVYSDPIITTTLVQSNSLRYTIMGEVGAPGVFFLDYPITISQTVARAGGFTEWSKRNITVIRKEVQERDKNLFKGNTLKFSYDDFVSGRNIASDIPVRPGDYLVVN
jgi:polysaccharide export outer membrane protein